ncbi:TetR/AcrR family transcriptional regulator [Arthrobacter sp. HMWF013]|uniref:TetR/AcrR family transcriptional regulator n=1 Tax=Arthrobacter sp. HMWF013 TaxID=2056849 RepID=UPI000D3CDC9C|nr:TetR family transcriptional regulator [Arthrobacter sp. HMWF013]PTT64168.1 TetR/AcrR family transcriptional regulator [Arthrobacter sp. HMWF013]
MPTTPAPTARPKRQGRRPGTSGSRQVILDAAQARFAQEGYAGATIRKIAADAGVDASLVMQFFGSKDELFGAVMSITLSTLSRFSEAFEGPEHSLGERVTRAFLQVWDGDPKDSEPLLAMLRSAISNEQASSQLREFIQARLTEAIAPQLPHLQDTATRAGIASSMLIGLVVGRRIVKVPSLVSEDTESLVRYIAPAVQAILTGGHDA